MIIMENDLKQVLENISLDQNQTLLSVLISFVLCILCSYILQITYQRYSRSISSRFQFSHLFPILSGTTFLVIVIVKSSIALSLGLVGALSIVRFRTPIKEPEELIYLFLAIGLGIGFGANQIVTTLGIFILLILIIFFITKNKTEKLSKSHNLVVEIEVKKSDEFKNETLINIAKKNFESSKLIRIDSEEKDEVKKINFFLEIILNNVNEIDKFTNDINMNYANSHISFFENDTQF